MLRNIPMKLLFKSDSKAKTLWILEDNLARTSFADIKFDDGNLQVSRNCSL